VAVETDTERAVFFSSDDFGVTATYTPSGGAAASITGIFDDEFEPIEAGGFVPVASTAPIFHCKTSDVSAAAEGDALTVNSTSYIIRVVMNDGTGTTMLQLEKQ
tara:strand:+ start:2141 stop:2452 length:312 start_codon:yes stop_codon:yes gene_type:complete